MIESDELLNTTVYEQPYQKEKDYIEELFLSSIYSAVECLVFKGGTAISKFYGSARFSDDLDFSVLPGHNAGELSEALDEVVGHIAGLYPIKIMRKRRSEKMLVYELSVRGPLFDMLNKYQHLKIEVDTKASVVSRTETYRRNTVYRDLKPYVAVVMSKREILSEKIVALLFRRNAKARDLYDIYFLLKNNTDIDVSMMDKKMREYGHTFTTERFMARIGAMESVWAKELRRLLPVDRFVEYGNARKYVVERFDEISLL